MKIQIINGPNLNLLGKREPEIYGNMPFDKYLEILNSLFPNFTIEYYQSNIEGEIINKIQEIGNTYDGIIINAGGYTHTSVAIADALSAINCKAIEVHISNITNREEYRHTSLISPKCNGSIIGFGLDGYRLSIEALRVINNK
ncbi:MAG: type II 3-dehydroquinate dehydratase [Bacteroidota bacterium]|nr:type II 3-dehydroquinate dehydratase [Bacteroidota bacterium]